MGKIAILFPGQGAQTKGMGKEEYDSSDVIRSLYSQASEILGYDAASLCFEDPEGILNTTEASQPSIYLTSMAALESLREKDPEVLENCQAAAGLSLGEYSALVFAGALSFEDGLRLVQTRGRAMQLASDVQPSGMVSILGLDVNLVQEFCDQAKDLGPIIVANYLCPGNYVVSGTREACTKVVELAQAAGAMKVVPLAVAGAFHTSIMTPAIDILADVLKKTTFLPPRIPVYSNVDRRPHYDPEDIRATLLKQICSPVRWEDTMRLFISEGFDHFYEVGPGRVLRGLMKRIDRKMKMN